MRKYSAEIMSACDGVTGSQTLIVVHRNDETKKILVDCGWNFELIGKDQKIISQNPDYVILTHSHTDHVACLPELCKTYDRPIYTSKDTKVLLGASLDDTFMIQKGIANSQDLPMLFNEQDIAKAISQVKPVNLNKRIEIGDEIFITLIPNSHIPGATCVFIEIGIPKHFQSEDYEIPPMNFFFTGDLKTKNNPFLKDTVIPKEILKKPVYIITESTYGGEDRKREKVFKKNLEKASKKGKTIIIPVLSLGRAQQILLEVKNMQENENIPKEVPIFVDGKLLFRYNNKYRSQLDVLEKNFEPEGLIYVSKEMRPTVRELGKSCIVISSSGNASFGPSNEYVANNIDNPNAVLHFTSYQPEGTLGRKLVESEKGDEILVNGSKKVIKAQVLMTSEYSSHDEKKDLIRFIESFKNIKGIFVTHGEQESRESIIKTLKEDLKDVDIVNLNSQHFIRIDRLKCGKIKRINSKFDLEKLRMEKQKLRGKRFKSARGSVSKKIMKM